MYVTLYSYRAKPDQMQAIEALYEQGQQLLSRLTVISAELLARADDPAEIIMLVHFKDEATAWAAMETCDYRAWYAQLVRAAETGPVVSYYT